MRRSRNTRLTPIGAITSALVEELVPVPVTYRGVQMRSTLEGKWAAFFDHLGITWEYEAAPVQLHGRSRWVDFWSSTLNLWLEVKPAGTPPDEALGQAVAEETGSPLLWIAGSPWPGDYRITLLSGDRPPIPRLRFALGRRDHSEIWLCDPASVLAIRLAPPMGGEAMDWETAQGIAFPLFDCHALREAYRAASTWEFAP